MAHYYVDAAAAGTGDGLSPTNAFVSVKSIPWVAGDKGWIRRTHKEDLTSNSMVIGPIPSSGWSARAFSRIVNLTGWPDATMPLFNERPAAGVSAGWDADNSTLPTNATFGYNFPTFCHSVADGFDANAGMVIGSNMILSNICFSNSAPLGQSALPFSPNNFGTGAGITTVLNNFLCINPASGNTSMMMRRINITNGFGYNAERFILCGSSSDSTGFLASNIIKVKTVIVHSLSVLSGILGGAGKQDVGLIVNHSNSVALLIKRNQTGPAIDGVTDFYLQRATGIEPFSGARSTEGAANALVAVIDDYFGKGPYLFGGDSQSNLSRGLIASDGQYNGQPVIRYQTNSNAVSQQNYFSALNHRPLVMMPVNVSSGIKVEIRVPIYVDATAIFSPGAYAMTAQLLARGAIPVLATDSTVIAGSATPWTGVMASGGTPYEMVCVYTPTETATVPFNLYTPPYFQTTSGQQRTAYALFGQPYVVP